MWFVSSRPGELSYEDEQLGGLFTHFFIEAFTAAPPDRVGVTLEGMWDYSVQRTAAYAARFGRSQTPEKIVRDLKARSPLYFSFAQDRSARLRFMPGVEGTFLILYEQAALAERVVKRAGEAMEVAVFPGALSLRRVDSRTSQEASRRFEIEPGALVLLQPRGAEAAAHGPGFAEVPIRGKGALPEIELTRDAAQSVAALEVGYRFVLGRPELLGADHSVTVGAGVMRGHLALGAEASYGPRRGTYPEWSFREHELGLGVRGGYGFDLGLARLDVELELAASLHLVYYGNGASRAPPGGLAAAGLKLTWPIPQQHPFLLAQLRAGGGALVGQGLAEQDRAQHVAAFPYLGLSLAVPLSR